MRLKRRRQSRQNQPRLQPRQQSLLRQQTITVKTKKGEVVISISDASKITVGKETKSLADVKVGDKVKVTVAKSAKKAEKNPCAKNPCGKK
ncbi:MAG: hypothetical protein HZB81_02655 [Deltaproteobacteria bacterium]|nr:hypothetical protein [Deltaproteobacteria bacterium]